MITPAAVVASMSGNGGIGSEAYLDAFMNGFEFVLLAIQGRLAEAGLREDERRRLEAFLDDYWRIARAYHDRRPKESPRVGALPAIHGRFEADAALAPAN